MHRPCMYGDSDVCLIVMADIYQVGKSTGYTAEHVRSLRCKYHPWKCLKRSCCWSQYCGSPTRSIILTQDMHSAITWLEAFGKLLRERDAVCKTDLHVHLLQICCLIHLSAHASGEAYLAHLWRQIRSCRIVAVGWLPEPLHKQLWIADSFQQSTLHAL